MRSNNRPNICCENLRLWKPLLHSLLQGLGAIWASTMAHDNGFPHFRHPALFHFGELGLDGLFSPPWFFYHGQFPSWLT